MSVHLFTNTTVIFELALGKNESCEKFELIVKSVLSDWQKLSPFKSTFKYQFLAAFIPDCLLLSSSV